MQPKKRVALFVEAHEGLGHFNIVRQLAEDLLDQDEDTEVMILSGTMHKLQANQLFHYDRCKIVELPLVDLQPAGEGRYEYTTPSGATYLKDEAAVSERMKAVKENLETFKPEAIVFEFYPFRQSFREPDMIATQSLGSDILKVCLCRDIIHSRDTEGTLRRLKAFDYVIVRGDDSIIRLADSQKEWSSITIPLLYSGYFVSEQPYRKTQLGTIDPIVVFAGGGFHVDDIDFFQAIIAARKLSHAAAGNTSTNPSGSLLPRTKTVPWVAPASTQEGPIPLAVLLLKVTPASTQFVRVSLLVLWHIGFAPFRVARARSGGPSTLVAPHGCDLSLL